MHKECPETTAKASTYTPAPFIDQNLDFSLSNETITNLVAPWGGEREATTLQTESNQIMPANYTLLTIRMYEFRF